MQRWMLHIGAGSFHRAHQAVYMNRVQQRFKESPVGRDWRLAVGNMRADNLELMENLKHQNGTYTLETITPEHDFNYERIRGINRVSLFSGDCTNLAVKAADPDTRIISWTVTEAGYFLRPDGQLNLDHPAIVHDLDLMKNGKKKFNNLQSIYGLLASFLKARLNVQGGAVTLLNCDNVRHNGTKTKAALATFLDGLEDKELSDWTADNTTYPNCMVDRITPRPTEDVIRRCEAATGVYDPTAISSESYIQWVIEDNFANGRPNFEDVGVEMVADVAPYEEAKIRLLNATHSCIAWAGTLSGSTYIHEGVQDPSVRKLAYDYATDDVIPCLLPSPVDLNAYRDSVLHRFENPALMDTNQRVAQDGFSKVQGFILPTIKDRLAKNESIDSVVMLPALFLAFLKEWSANRLPFEYQDANMDVEDTQRMLAADDVEAAFVANTALFKELAGDARLLAALRQAMVRVEAFRAQSQGGVSPTICVEIKNQEEQKQM